MDIEKRLITVLAGADAGLSFDSLADAVRGVAHDRLRSALSESRRIFFDPVGGMAILRTRFLRGAKFQIVLTPLEVKERVLIPGHRFAPFLPPDRKPGEIAVGTPDGTAFATRRLRRPRQEWSVTHSLFGPEGFAALAAAEGNDWNPSDRDALRAPIELTVLDLRKFYKLENLEAGDALIVTVRDWDAAQFEITGILRDDVPVLAHDLRLWREHLEAGFERAFAELGPTAGALEQAAYAFFFAGHAWLQQPMLSIGKFLEISHKVALAHHGPLTLFWRKGESWEQKRAQIDPGNQALVKVARPDPAKKAKSRDSAMAPPEDSLIAKQVEKRSE